MATTNHSNPPSFFFLVICAALLLATTSPPPTAVAGSDHHHHHNHLATPSSWILPTTTAAMKPQCKGSIWECLLEGEDEFDLDSESNRRILATSQYISYGALQRNTVPCSRRGASYYNCRPGAQANPYSRGCSAITRCRG